MVTGFDMMGHDARLHKHWLYRMLAILIDGILVFVTFGIIFTVFDIDGVYLAGLTSSLSFFLYSAIFEAVTGATPGKLIFGLRVRPLTSDKIAPRIIFRNLPKILWFIHLPLDTVLGLATRGDPRQRFFDRMALTTVVQAKEPDFHHYPGHQKNRELKEEEKKSKEENGDE